jgi:hypothetical protein
MPITYYYFCVLATLLYSFPNITFLETARFELVLLWDKLSQTTFKQDLNILIPYKHLNNGVDHVTDSIDHVPNPVYGVPKYINGVVQRGKRGSERGKCTYLTW